MFILATWGLSKYPWTKKISYKHVNSIENKIPTLQKFPDSSIAHFIHLGKNNMILQPLMWWEASSEKLIFLYEGEKLYYNFNSDNFWYVLKII